MPVTGDFGPPAIVRRPKRVLHNRKCSKRDPRRRKK